MSRLYILFLILVIYEESFGNDWRQERAVIKVCNSKYITNCSAITKRLKRGESYRTNITGTTLVPYTNNVTMTVQYGIKGYANMMAFKTKVCDAVNVDWIKEYVSMFSNIPLQCPIMPGVYGVYNMELPPKNFPLPIPKGDIYLTLGIQVTDTKEIILECGIVGRFK